MSGNAHLDEIERIIETMELEGMSSVGARLRAIVQGIVVERDGWFAEAADHEVVANSLTVELHETKARLAEAEARIALIAPLVNAAIEMYLWEGSTDYPNGDPEVEKRRQAFYSAVHDLWDLHDDELDFLEGASAPDATERTHERV